jgi:hypothetical protein
MSNAIDTAMTIDELREWRKHFEGTLAVRHIDQLFAEIDSLHAQLEVLTREKDDALARVEELKSLGGCVGCGDASGYAIDRLLSFPTAGAADRLRIEGMKISIEIVEDELTNADWPEDGDLEPLADGITAVIRSRIAGMKGEGEC